MKWELLQKPITFLNNSSTCWNITTAKIRRSRSAEDNKNLTNAAESLGLITGGEDAESFAEICLYTFNGIAVETFQESLSHRTS